MLCTYMGAVELDKVKIVEERKEGVKALFLFFLCGSKRPERLVLLLLQGRAYCRRVAASSSSRYKYI